MPDRISRRAKVSPDQRFGNLFSLLNEENLLWCFPQLSKKSAPGVDAVAYGTFEANLDEDISRVVEDLKAGRYKAKIVNRDYFSKAGGKQHPLGIPTIPLWKYLPFRYIISLPAGISEIEKS